MKTLKYLGSTEVPHCYGLRMLLRLALCVGRQQDRISVAFRPTSNEWTKFRATGHGRPVRRRAGTSQEGVPARQGLPRENGIAPHGIYLPNNAKQCLFNLDQATLLSWVSLTTGKIDYYMNAATPLPSSQRITGIKTVLCLAVAAMLTGCATTPTPQASPAMHQALQITPPPGMAGVCILRPSHISGSAVACQIGLDAGELGPLANGDLLFVEASPGDHEMRAQAINAPGVPRPAVHFHAEAGRNYFFQVRLGMLRLEMEPLQELAGLNCMKDLAMRNCRPQTATSPGHWEVFKTQVETGASVDFQDEKGLTPLFFAARHGDTNAMAFLLLHGADANHKSNTGETPLMWAASGPGDDWALANESISSSFACSAPGVGDNLPVVISLVKAGADLNARTKNGVTAMGFAALWGNSSIALWLYDQGAAADIPEQQCEVNGRLAQVLGDYYMAQDKVEEARASFERAERSDKATVKSIKAQLATQALVQTLIGMAQIAVAAAGQHQANIQAHQMVQIAALSHASRSGGGVTAYSAYLQKYNKVYVPTYHVGFLAPPDPSDPNDRIKYYENLEKFMGRVVACFASYADLAELHGRIENLRGQSRPPYTFAIGCIQQAARDYAAKTGLTNVGVSPMELPDNLYGKQMENEIHFGESALWRLTIMSGWTPATQAKKGYDLNSPFLRITFFDAQKTQTGEVFFRMNQEGDKMTIVYKTNSAGPPSGTIDGEFDLSNYESRIKDDLEKITKTQLAQMGNSRPIIK
jgi:hypothetical protein